MLGKNPTLFILTILSLARPLPAAGKTDSKEGLKTEKPLISLSDLGFSEDEIKGSPQFQKELQTRSDMLQIHQALGIITAVPMTTEFVLGIVTAGNVAKGSTDTGLHATLGVSTAVLYGATAMFAILAPKPKGLKPSGNTAVHVDLAWVHAPLMAAVPILGGIINSRVQNHLPVGDLAAVHGILAGTLLASYLTSLVVITF